MRVRTTIRLNDDLKERFNNQAKYENRSFSNLLEIALMRYLENYGPSNERDDNRTREST